MSFLQKIFNYFSYEFHFLDFSFRNFMIKTSENTNEIVCVLESSTSEVNKVQLGEDLATGLCFFIVPIIACLLCQNSTQVNESFNLLFDTFFGSTTESSESTSDSLISSDSSSTELSNVVEVIENLSDTVEVTVSQPLVIDNLPFFGKVYMMSQDNLPSWLDNWVFDYSSMLNALNLVRDRTYLDLDVNVNLFTSYTYHQIARQLQLDMSRCTERVYEFLKLLDLKVKKETTTGSLEAIEQYIDMNFMELLSENVFHFLALFDLIWGERSAELLLFILNAS